MTLPANLFVDTPEMEDVSLHQLGNDAESWPEEIVQKVKERLPAAQGMNLVVKFMKKDDENGVATGSVTAHTADKVVTIPVIIKDFMMSPLDVMIAGGKLLPLTNDYFNAFFANNEIFTQLEEYPSFAGLGRFEDANLFNSVYPPSLGRYSYASAGYPICDIIASSADGTELKKFLLDGKNEKFAARLLSGPHREIVQKLANLQPVNMGEFSQGARNLVPNSVAVLRYESPNKYTLLSTPDHVFHPSVVELNRDEACSVVSKISDHVEDDLNEVDQNGEKILQAPTGGDGPVLATLPAEVIDEIREFGPYTVKTKSGLAVKGVCIPRVCDFDMKMVGLRVFLGKTHSSVQPEIYGVREPGQNFKLPRSSPKIGQTGVFVYQPDASHAICTVPVTITAVVASENAVRVQDLMGRPLTLVMGFGPGSELDVQRISKSGPGRYVLPGKMKWVPMEPMTEVTNSAVDYAAKTAAEVMTTNAVTMIPTGYNQWALKGVGKYASVMGLDATNLRSSEAKFLLCAVGVPSTKIASLMKEASIRGKTVVYGTNEIPLLSEKAAAMAPVADRMRKLAESLKRNLIKEAAMLSGLSKKASYLENSQTVDALLSLNFVNPYNITKYVAKLPALKAAVSHLASMLLASRLGLKEIPEQSASAAMNRLVEVIEGLERLKAGQEIAPAK